MRPVRRTAIHPCRRAQRRRRRAARTVASHRQPADLASRRDLVRARRDHAAALRPERASPRPRRRGRDAPPSTSSTGPPQPPCTDRPLRPEQAPRRQANRVNRPAGGTLSTTMFEQPIDTRFPRATVPRGERRHVPRRRPAHRLPRRYGASAPRSQEVAFERRDVGVRPDSARSLGWTPLSGQQNYCLIIAVHK